MLKNALGAFLVAATFAPASAVAGHPDQASCDADTNCIWRTAGGGFCLCKLQQSPSSYEPIDVSGGSGWICIGANYEISYSGRSLVSGDGVNFVVEDDQVLVCAETDRRGKPRDVLPRNRRALLANQLGRAMEALRTSRQGAFESASEDVEICAAGNAFEATAKQTIGALNCLANLPPETAVSDACAVCGCGDNAARLGTSLQDHNTTRSNRCGRP